MTIEETIAAYDDAESRTAYDLDLYRGDVEDGGEETQQEKAAELRDSLRKLAQAATDLATALDQTLQ